MKQPLNRKQFIRSTIQLTVVFFNGDQLFSFFNSPFLPSGNKKVIDPFLKKLVLSQTFSTRQDDPIKTINTYYALGELYRLSVNGQLQDTVTGKEDAIKEALEIAQKNKTIDKENFEDIAILLGGSSVSYDEQLVHDQYWIGKISSVGKLGLGLMTPGAAVPGVLLGVAGIFSDDALKYSLSSNGGRGVLFSPPPSDRLATLNTIAYNKILTNAEKNPLFNTLLKSGGLNDILKMAVGDDDTIDVDRLPDNIKALIEKTVSKDLANSNNNANDLDQTLKEYLLLTQNKLDETNIKADQMLKEIEQIKIEEQVKQRQQQAAAEMQKMYGEIEGMAQIGAFVLDKIFKSPSLANNFSKTFQTGSKVFSLINQFQLGQIGSLALTGGMLSAGVAFASVLGGGPSFEQQVMQQLEGIDKKLDFIINMLDERFNRIEKTQEEILKQLSLVLKEVRDGNTIALNNFVIGKSKLEYIKTLITEIDRFNHQLTLKQETEDFISLSALHPKLTDEVKIDYHKHLNYFYVYAIDISRSLPNSGFDSTLSETDANFPTKLNTVINDKQEVQYVFGLLPLITKVYNLNIPFTIAEADSIPNPVEWARGANLYLDAKITYHAYLTDQIKRELVAIWDVGTLIRKICIFLTSQKIISRIANIYLDRNDGIVTDGYPNMVKFVSNVLYKWGGEKLMSFKPDSVHFYGFGLGVLQEGRIIDKNVYFQFVELYPRTAGVLYDNDPLAICIKEGIVELREVKKLDCEPLYDDQKRHIDNWNKQTYQITQRLCSIKFVNGKFRNKTIGGNTEGLIETTFSLMWTPPGEEAKFGTRGVFRQYKWTMQQPLHIELDNFNNTQTFLSYKIRPNTDGMQDILDLLITEYREHKEYDLFRENFTDYLKHEFDLALNSVTSFENNATIVRTFAAIAHWTLSLDSSKYESDIRNIPIISSVDQILDYSNSSLTDNFNLTTTLIRNFRDFYWELLREDSELAKIIRSKLAVPVLDGITRVVRDEIKDSDDLRNNLISNLNIIINGENLLNESYTNLFISPEEIKHIQQTCTADDEHVSNRMLMDKTFVEIQRKIRIKDYTRRYMVDYYSPANPWALNFCEGLNSEFKKGYNFVLEYNKLRIAQKGLKGPVVVDETLSKIGSYLYWKDIPFDKDMPASLQKELEEDNSYSLASTFLFIKENSINRFEDFKMNIISMRGPEVRQDGSNLVFRSTLLLPIKLEEGVFKQQSPLIGQVSELGPTLMYFFNKITGKKQFVPVFMVNSMVLLYRLEINDKTKQGMAQAFNQIISILDRLIPTGYIRINTMQDSIYQFMEKDAHFERGDNTSGWQIFEPDSLLCEVICFNGNSDYPKLVEVPASFSRLLSNPFENMQVGDMQIRFLVKKKDSREKN